MTVSQISSKGWTLSQWRQAYQDNQQTPEALLTALVASLDSRDVAWISIATQAQLQEQMLCLRRLLAQVNGDMAQLPLYGVPFAVKDNMDVQGWQTTAACPDFAYTAQADAFVVQQLRQAGAILVGKTNLDQFATGLVGTRSPFGAVPNTFDARYVSGGSSSGSASVVARGLVPFSLGTDTAGSGRVPAAFNNIVGLKPTKGWVSNTGVVPACKTLDCVSVFALTVGDANTAVQTMAGYDAADPYSRPKPAEGTVGFRNQPRLGVPAQLEFCGDALAQAHFAANLDALKKQGAALVEVDFSAFAELAQLLYQGPWVAERYAAIEAMLTEKPEAVHPVVRAVIEQARNYSAVDAFKAEYVRAQLTRKIQTILASVDALVVPSTPSIFTIEQLTQEPVKYNSALGTYTNFTNLADLCALALPAGLRQDGLPAGITLIAPAWHDAALVAFGQHWQAAQSVLPGAPHVVDSAHHAVLEASVSPAASAGADEVIVAVVGAHLRGMPLNHQLTSRGARFLEEASTAPSDYRLYALANTQPPKPGLKRTPGAGAAIALELWALPVHAFGAFTAEILAPLGMGNVQLADGRMVKGFICEPAELESAQDITAFGGWRAYIQSL